jgi:hypothetical protein
MVRARGMHEGGTAIVARLDRDRVIAPILGWMVTKNRP